MIEKSDLEDRGRLGDLNYVMVNDIMDTVGRG
jgi:hypothetical protein